jgi:alpha-tubulin suppressor-like RCC1 family protein
MADKYDMSIDFRDYENKPCYVFTIKVKEGQESAVVISEMTTWFTEKNFEIVARNYSLNYDAGVYDFKVDMEVKMSKVGDLLVPILLSYNGNWKVILKKRERGVFTATLFDFINRNG